MSLQAELHEEESIGKVYDGRLFRRLLGYVRPHRTTAAAAVALIILSSLLQLVGPLATAVALDLFIVPGLSDGGESATTAPRQAGPRQAGPRQAGPRQAGPRQAGPRQADEAVADHRATVSRWVAQRLDGAGIVLAPMTGLGILAGIFGVLLIVTFGVLFVQSYVMQIMGQLIMFDLRSAIFGHLQKLPVAYFDRRPIGRLVTRATTDVAALNELFTAGLVSIFGDVVLLVGIVWVLFLLNWKLALVSFAVLPLIFGLTTWFKLGARRSYRSVRIKVAAINSFLQEHITGMSVVQLNSREQRAFDDFSRINAQHRDAHVQSIYFYAIYYPAVMLFTALGLALIVWYGGGQILRGFLSFGALVAFLQYAQRFYQPLADLSEKYNILQSAMASSERIFELLDTEPDIVTPADPYRPSEVRGEIEFENVSFAYVTDQEEAAARQHSNRSELVLDDISFRVRPGEMVAVVGHTGAGKTTLTNLLLRFYDVRSGNIRIDGVDVREWDVEVLRRHLALVLQDVFLFAGDVAENIRLGEASISDDKLRWAAEEVGALDFIERLPAGFESEIRERGAGLSVGQKQLIAFARALAFDPRILILDEATASIDTETEQRIQNALDRLLEHRTSIVIAHRLSTIQKADRILVMHKGKLREQGSHRELLALGGIYHKLYLLQYRDEPRDATIAESA